MPRVRVIPGPNVGSGLDVLFNYDPVLVDAIRTVKGRQWDRKRRCWTIPATPAAITAVLHAVGAENVEIASAALGALRNERPALELDDETRNSLLQRTKQELGLRRYAPATQRAYLKQLRRFLTSTSVRQLDAESIRDYLSVQLERGISSSYHAHVVGALRFFCERVVQDVPLSMSFPAPKRQKRLPAVLSADEVRRLILAIDNPKHRAAVMVAYSGGLRVGEVARLKLADIDYDREVIVVRGAKGGKDRTTRLSRVAAAALQAYCAVFRPSDWLFPGARRDRHISVRSLQSIVSRARKRAGILKRASAHTLRHSFATHLHEQGIDLRYIQELLGHASPSTTEIYTNVSQRDLARIPSPLDQLGL